MIFVINVLFTFLFLKISKRDHKIKRKVKYVANVMTQTTTTFVGIAQLD